MLSSRQKDRSMTDEPPWGPRWRVREEELDRRSQTQGRGRDIEDERDQEMTATKRNM